MERRHSLWLNAKNFVWQFNRKYHQECDFHCDLTICEHHRTHCKSRNDGSRRPHSIISIWENQRIAWSNIFFEGTHLKKKQALERHSFVTEVLASFHIFWSKRTFICNTWWWCKDKRVWTAMPSVVIMQFLRAFVLYKKY